MTQNIRPQIVTWKQNVKGSNTIVSGIYSHRGEMVTWRHNHREVTRNRETISYDKSAQVDKLPQGDKTSKADKWLQQFVTGRHIVT